MFSDAFVKKTVLITGHTGFKGSWLVAWLQKLGAKVYGVSAYKPSCPCHFDAIANCLELTSIEGDVRNDSLMHELITSIKPDFVFHLAAQPLVFDSYENPLQTFEVNTMGTANILNSLRFLDNECAAVLITSDKCYENREWEYGYRETDRMGGSDPYSASKGAAELIFNSFYRSYFENKTNVKIATARAGNVIGGGDWAKSRIMPDTMRAWSNNSKVELRNPNSTRPWQHVLEPLSGYLWLAANLGNDSRLNGEAFNFGPSTNCDYSVLEVVKEISKSWPGSSYKINMNVDSRHEASLLKLSCDKAMSQLNWRPAFTFEEMCKCTSEWYKDYYSSKGEKINTFCDIAIYESKAQERKIKWAS